MSSESAGFSGVKGWLARPLLPGCQDGAIGAGAGTGFPPSFPTSPPAGIPGGIGKLLGVQVALGGDGLGFAWGSRLFSRPEF